MTDPKKAPAVPDRGPEKFTVLVVEDIDKIRNDIAKRLRRSPDVTVLEAGTKAEAIDAMKAHYIDAATVDIELKSVRTAGLDVLINLGQRCPNCHVVIATQHVRTNQGEILTEYIGATRPRIIKVHDKNKEKNSDVAIPLEAVIEDWRSSQVRLENEELPLGLLWERRKREGFKGRLRENRDEVRIEFERACRELFGGIQRIADGIEATVSFKPIDREGMSSAVTIKADVTLGTDAAGKPVKGSRCVLKVGPLEDIEEEVRRYHHFVKFGVRLAERVELLASTLRDGFGAIAYSFAGGVFGEDLLTLDELLKTDEGRGLAKESIARLFEPANRNWYGVSCEEEPPVVFVSERKFEKSYEFLHNSLKNLRGQFRERGYGLTAADEDKDGSFEFLGGKLTIPTMRIRGHDAISPSRPQCFVHGDMHGGNVMVEVAGNGNGGNGNGGLKMRRICLIDYRRAGTGPRPIDAAALQASLRLADAQAICDEITGESDSTPAGEDLAEAVDLAARRTYAEQSLLEELWSGPAPEEVEPDPETTSWESTALLIARMMRMNFKDMSQEEYLAIAVPSGMRQFGYPMSPVAKVRMLAWVSAMWESLRGLVAVAEADE